MLKKIADGSIKIAIVGLGYVGLPLAVEFGKKFDTVGFDRKAERTANLRRQMDATGTFSASELQMAKYLRYSDDPENLRDRDVFIVAVPTPVDKHNRPDLAPLLDASAMIGKVMKRGAVVIYESTVYPGCTEEECVPVLARESGMTFNRDFFCGYSPERINPGDKVHTLTKIVKLTSASTQEAADLVDKLYNSILRNGTYRVNSIKVAEAAKVIENSQRDINIAFVNELAKIFHLIGIDTREVLEAAQTKWNFLPFTPGLVGGHCIGVDPYYLTHKAQELGYLPEVILAGRRINDGMGKYVAAEVVKLMTQKKCAISGADVLQLGIAFKENCGDTRNSRAADVARELQEFGCNVAILDPFADPEEVRQYYALDVVRTPAALAGRHFDAIILTVAHRNFAELDLSAFKKAHTVVYDVKAMLPKSEVDGRL